jgi:RNA polymerase sigma-70 factor, ECF subfamily
VSDDDAAGRKKDELAVAGGGSYAPVEAMRAEEPDAQLVAAARAGDRRGCEALYRRHARMANGLALRLLGRDSEVDDVVQDAFTTAFLSMTGLKDAQAFSSWLCSIVVRSALRSIRRRRLMHRLGLLRRDPIDPESIVASTAPADVAAELRAIYGVLDQMPHQLGTMLVLQRVEGMLLPEIAEAMSLSVSTVKRRLVQAEALFAKRVGPREGRS